MTHSDHHPQKPENAETREDAAPRIDASDDSTDLGNDLADGIIAEIAGEKASEGKKDSGGKSATASVVQQKDDFSADDRLALRDRLLKTAPKELLMRKEVVKALKEKKVQLESNIRGYERRREYHLLSTAVAQLRAVIRQIEIVAHAGYEALRELWLKVVHHFA